MHGKNKYMVLVELNWNVPLIISLVICSMDTSGFRANDLKIRLGEIEGVSSVRRKETSIYW